LFSEIVSYDFLISEYLYQKFNPKAISRHGKGSNDEEGGGLL
jgi:hypothetical protein